MPNHVRPSSWAKHLTRIRTSLRCGFASARIATATLVGQRQNHRDDPIFFWLFFVKLVNRKWQQKVVAVSELPVRRRSPFPPFFYDSTLSEIISRDHSGDDKETLATQFGLGSNAPVKQAESSLEQKKIEFSPFLLVWKGWRFFEKTTLERTTMRLTTQDNLRIPESRWEWHGMEKVGTF